MILRSIANEPYPGSTLAELFGGLADGDDPCVPSDETGAFVLDRDGISFRFVLNYLRAPAGVESELPPIGMGRAQLAAEADFYMLPELQAACNRAGSIGADCAEAYARTRSGRVATSSLSKLDLRGCSFRGLTGFTRHVDHQLDMTNSDLRGADFVGATLGTIGMDGFGSQRLQSDNISTWGTSPDLTGARMDGATFQETLYGRKRTVANNIICSDSFLSGASLRGCDLRGLSIHFQAMGNWKRGPTRGSLEGTWDVLSAKLKYKGALAGTIFDGALVDMLTIRIYLCIPERGVAARPMPTYEDAAACLSAIGDGATSFGGATGSAAARALGAAGVRFTYTCCKYSPVVKGRSAVQCMARMLEELQTNEQVVAANDVDWSATCS